jgi:hypothetical protein
MLTFARLDGLPDADRLAQNISTTNYDVFALNPVEKQIYIGINIFRCDSYSCFKWQ